MLYFFGLICTVSILCGTSGAQPDLSRKNLQYSLKDIGYYPVPVQENQPGGKIQYSMLLRNIVDAIREKLNQNGNYKIVDEGREKFSKTNHKENSKLKDEGAEGLRRSQVYYTNKLGYFTDETGIDLTNLKSLTMKIEGDGLEWNIY